MLSSFIHILIENEKQNECTIALDLENNNATMSEPGLQIRNNYMPSFISNFIRGRLGYKTINNQIQEEDNSSERDNRV
jgi:hypothetical protein